MRKTSLLRFIGSFLLAHFSVFCFSQTISVTDPRCEYQTNPLGIDIARPHFSWVLQSALRAQKQTAYQLIVSNDYNAVLKGKGDVWETGKVPSAQSLQVQYNGQTLQPFTRYFWRVRVYDKIGRPSAWSTPAWFETAALQPSDWKAAWISDAKPLPTRHEDFYKDNPAPIFRKIFRLSKQVHSARLYISGLGYYKATINGRRVGKNFLDPGWTAYAKQVLYSTYDVTSHIRSGNNVVSVMLGNGWYNPLPLRMWGSKEFRAHLATGNPCLTAMMRITYTDGTTYAISTDKSWQVLQGPVLRNSVYLGEHYDARLEQSDERAQSTAGNAVHAKETTGPQGTLTAQLQPPIKIIRTLVPKTIKETKSGTFVVDMGQNFAGVVRIRVKGKAGTCVRLRYGEDLDKAGNVNLMTGVAGQIKTGNGGPGAPHIAWQEDSYTLKGQGTETWNPEFTFHGFRYVEVSGWPGRPEPTDIDGLCLSADVSNAGHFNCSNNMFNRIAENSRWTFRNNLFSVQSDCPAREKLGYGGDMFCTTNAFSFNYNMANFYRKVMQDYIDEQRPSGAFTETAPFVGIADFGPAADDGSGPISFQIGVPNLMRHLYQFYGDIRPIETYYDNFKRQVDYLLAHATNNLLMIDISDHESLDEKPTELTASAWLFYHVKLLVDFARVLNKTNDVEKYQPISENIKQALLRNMFTPATGTFANGTQTAQIFGLWFPFLEGKERDAAMKQLKKAIDTRNGHLSTGIFATKMMFDVFRRADRNDVAYRIADQRDYPGWGYMIDNGATTLWETWAYSDNTYSQDHPMFGSINEWFYRSLLGINPAAPGFEKIQIKPQPTGNLKHAEGYYNSVRGRIGSKWETDGHTFRLHVTIPANTTAEVWVPSSSNTVTESGIAIEKHKEISTLERRGNYAVVQIGSGNYHFEAAL